MIPQDKTLFHGKKTTCLTVPSPEPETNSELSPGKMLKILQKLTVRNSIRNKEQAKQSNYQ
jgi:hypothetical protein